MRNKRDIDIGGKRTIYFSLTFVCVLRRSFPENSDEQWPPSKLFLTMPGVKFLAILEKDIARPG